MFMKRLIQSFLVPAAAVFGILSPLANPQAAPVSVVTFYSNSADSTGRNAQFFLTADPDEMAILDSGAFSGWHRFWDEFKVDDAPGPDLVPVCRFYSPDFPPAAPHFYTAFEDECAALKANPSWIFEGDVFYVRLPDASGNCAAGTMPIYRGYNNGSGGYPSHRFTPYLSDQCASFDPGCTSEGLGPDGVAFCAPVSLDVAQQRTEQLIGGTWQFTYQIGGATRVVNLSFGTPVTGSPMELPPRWLLQVPYAATVLSANVNGANVAPQFVLAGWEPVAGRIDIILPVPYSNLLKFDFDGMNATSGCAFEFESLFDTGPGPCIPMTIRRM
ncbi:MAG: hypothetical protein ACM3SX_07005 [Deltaproteobacteria bacterium]